MQLGSKWNEGITKSICTKSSDQEMFQRGDQADIRGVRLSETNI